MASKFTAFTVSRSTLLVLKDMRKREISEHSWYDGRTLNALSRRGLIQTLRRSRPLRRYEKPITLTQRGYHVSFI